MAKVKELKSQLINELSIVERLTLIALLEKVTKPSRMALSPEDHLKHCDTPTLFGFLHQLLFGDWGNNLGASTFKVMEAIDLLKAKLRKSALIVEFPKQFNHLFVGLPEIPQDFKVSNATVQNVTVTLHAWERFHERFCPKASTSERVAHFFRKSFFRAVPASLSDGYATLRVIAAKGEVAEYFFDASINCRFVVVLLDGILSVKTVEIPHRCTW